MGGWPSVTISVLATFDAETIGECVASVLALDYPGELDVRIREHGGDDEQFAIIEKAVAEADSSDQVKVTVERGENVGFARGHNMAIRAGTGDFVLLVNADSVLAPDFLTAGMPTFAEPDVGTVQPKVLKHVAALDGSGPSAVIDTVGLLPSRKRLILSRGQGQPDEGQFDRVEDVFGADGAVVIYRRTALNDVAVPLSEVGDASADHDEYFDESFFIYKEDVDLSWRLALRGWRAVYVPAAQAWHVRTMRRHSEAKTPWQVLAQRRKVPAMGKFLSFGNHRLMQIKNETGPGLRHDALRWLYYELGTWVFFLVTEGRVGFRSVGRLFRLAPLAWRKRRYIQARRRSDADPYAWFV